MVRLRITVEQHTGIQSKRARNLVREKIGYMGVLPTNCKHSNRGNIFPNVSLLFHSVDLCIHTCKPTKRPLRCFRSRCFCHCLLYLKMTGMQITAHQWWVRHPFFFFFKLCPTYYCLHFRICFEILGCVLMVRDSLAPTTLLSCFFTIMIPLPKKKKRKRKGKPI